MGEDKTLVDIERSFLVVQQAAEIATAQEQTARSLLGCGSFTAKSKVNGKEFVLPVPSSCAQVVAHNAAQAIIDRAEIYQRMWLEKCFGPPKPLLSSATESEEKEKE